MARSLLLLIALVATARADGSQFGSAEDRRRAAAAYEKSCAKGDGEACLRAGLLAGDDAKHARPFFDRACAKQVVNGCFALAKLDGAVGDEKAKRASTAALERAVAILGARCAKKDAAACDRAASTYATLFDPPDPKRAEAMRDRACHVRTGAACAPPPPPPQPKIVKSKPVEMTVYASRAALPPVLAGAVPADFDFAKSALAVPSNLHPDARYMDFVVQAPSRESFAGQDSFTVVISSMNVCSGGAYRPARPMKPEEPEDPSRPAPKIVKATHPLWIVPRASHVWLEDWTTWHDCPPVP